MFSAKGQLKRSWGEPGKGPGQFYLPHGIAVDAEGRVYVCDREADRIQIFSPDGEYLSEWTDTQRPTHLCFDSLGRAYVTELAWHEGDISYSPGPDHQGQSAPRAHEHLRQERQDARALGHAASRRQPGSFAAPHGLALDSKNDLYVSEVTWTFAVSRGRGAGGLPHVSEVFIENFLKAQVTRHKAQGEEGSDVRPLSPFVRASPVVPISE